MADQALVAAALADLEGLLDVVECWAGTKASQGDESLPVEVASASAAEASEAPGSDGAEKPTTSELDRDGIGAAVTQSHERIGPPESAGGRTAIGEPDTAAAGAPAIGRPVNRAQASPKDPSWRLRLRGPRRTASSEVDRPRSSGGGGSAIPAGLEAGPRPPSGTWRSDPIGGPAGPRAEAGPDGSPNPAHASESGSSPPLAFAPVAALGSPAPLVISETVPFPPTPLRRRGPTRQPPPPSGAIRGEDASDDAQVWPAEQPQTLARPSEPTGERLAELMADALETALLESGIDLS